MMSHRVPTPLRLVCVLASAGLLVLAPGRAPGQQRRPPAAHDSAVFTVDGRIALHALMSLSDAHLRKMADVLTVLARTDDARSGDWARIRGPLAAIAPMNVPAQHWFALPGGRYWTVEHGRSDATLSDRPYFPSVLAGRTVIGELVTSRSSNRNTAIVAVPVRGRTGAVVGVLGASIHLDSLSAIVRAELGGLGGGLVFFAIDSKPLGALHHDTTMIFTDPMKLGDEEMRGAFTQMLAADEGTVTYTFRGSRRTMLFVRSPLSGWRYALGVSGAAASGAQGSADGRIPAQLRPAPTDRRQSAGAPPMASATQGAAGGSPPNKPGP